MKHNDYFVVCAAAQSEYPRLTVARAGQRRRPDLASGALLLVLALVAPPVRSQSCVVPGGHQTIQAAVDDPSCSEITLAARSYEESLAIVRTVTLSGAGPLATTIRGQVTIDAPEAQVTIRDLAIDTTAPTVVGCFAEALVLTGGALLNSHNLDVRHSALGNGCPLFADGFETGDLSAWSSSVP